MSSNARWGSVKIVVKIIPDKDPELVGGLRNAFERGESFAKAKQSFINAGYKPSDVDTAAHELRKLISPLSQGSATSTGQIDTSFSQKSRIKQLPTTSKILPNRKKRKIPKTLIIITVLILILIIATTLGLFWDKWF